MSLPSHTGEPSPKGSAGLGQPVLSAIPCTVGSPPGFVCPWMKNGFYIFNGWGKSKKRILFCDTWEFHEIQICVHKFYWKRDTPILDVFCGYFHGQSCLVVWSFIEKFLQPVFHGMVVHWSPEGLGEAKNLWVQLGEIWELQPRWLLSKSQKEPNVWGSSLRRLREDTSKCGCFIHQIQYICKHIENELWKDF